MEVDAIGSDDDPMDAPEPPPSPHEPTPDPPLVDVPPLHLLQLFSAVQDAVSKFPKHFSTSFPRALVDFRRIYPGYAQNPVLLQLVLHLQVPPNHPLLIGNPNKWSNTSRSPTNSTSFAYTHPFHPGILTRAYHSPICANPPISARPRHLRPLPVLLLGSRNLSRKLKPTRMHRSRTRRSSI